MIQDLYKQKRSWELKWEQEHLSNGRYTLEMVRIDDKVREIIANELGVEMEKVTDEASFVEDLGADSLDTVELVMAFEEEFGVEIPDEDAEQMLTVGDAIRYLQDKE